VDAPDAPFKPRKSALAGVSWGSPITIGLVARNRGDGENTRILPLEGAIIRRPSMLSRSEKGQGLAEYALILALIAIAAVLALMFLSGTIQTILSTIGAKL
jgi:pilus assembly protein Flp/PilA